MAEPLSIRVRLFGPFREAAGASERHLVLPAGSTAGDAVRRLREDGIASLPTDPTVAVNMEYVPLDHLLRGGDEVALIPPVSGG